MWLIKTTSVQLLFRKWPGHAELTFWNYFNCILGKLRLSIWRFCSCHKLFAHSHKHTFPSTAIVTTLTNKTFSCVLRLLCLCRVETLKSLPVYSFYGVIISSARVCTLQSPFLFLFLMILIYTSLKVTRYLPWDWGLRICLWLGPPWFSYWFYLTLAYSRISHVYLLCLLQWLIWFLCFRLWCMDWVGSLYANWFFMYFCIRSSIGT